MSFSTLITPSCRLCLRTVRSSFAEVSGQASTSAISSRSGIWPVSRYRQQRYQSTSSGRQKLQVKDSPHLFLHPITSSNSNSNSNNRYALSFLAEEPLAVESPTVLGTVTGTNVTPRTFEENTMGRQMIHEILSNVYLEDLGLQTAAQSRGEGFIHLLDERNLPALNRAGEPEDIIASVLCRDGKLVPGHYEEGSGYRLVTINGPIKLSESLTKQLVNGLQVARQIEQEMQREGQL